MSQFKFVLIGLRGGRVNSIGTMFSNTQVFFLTSSLSSKTLLVLTLKQNQTPTTQQIQIGKGFWFMSIWWWTIDLEFRAIRPVFILTSALCLWLCHTYPRWSPYVFLFPPSFPHFPQPGVRCGSVLWSLAPNRYRTHWLYPSHNVRAPSLVPNHSHH